MFPKCVERLADVLAVALRLNKARAQCFAGIVIGAAESKSFETALVGNFFEDNGAPAKPVRLMVGLRYLRHTFNLSDELTVERSTENRMCHL